MKKKFVNDMPSKTCQIVMKVISQYIATQKKFEPYAHYLSFCILKQEGHVGTLG
jgi:hypothetical protein